jgi:hypothetical protein
MTQRRFFPTPQHLLLLKFCLLADPDGARRAWQAWRAQIDLDDLDPSCFRLMSLVYRRMMDLGIDDRHLPRIKGLHRYHWTRNQLAWRGKDEVLRALEAKGTPTLLLKGAALSRTVYPEATTRGMHDLDILVPVANAATAMDVLAGLHWKAGHFDAVKTIDHLHACPFHHPEFGELDLHWHVFRSCCDTDRDDEMWAAARPFSVGDIKTHVLCPADQFLNACEHGLHPSPASALQWVVDATFIVRHSPPPFDWTRVIEQARKTHLVLPVRRTLHFIREHFEPSIPEEIMRQFDAIPVTALERTEYFLAGRSEEEHETLVIRTAVSFCHFLKLKQDRSWTGILQEFLVYFRLVNHERRPWLVVWRDIFLRWLLKARDDLAELGFRLGRFLAGKSRPVGGPISLMPPHRFRAFYKIEKRYGSAFRWSEPDASLDLYLAPGSYTLRLQLQPFRDLSKLWENDLAIRFNSHPLAPSDFQVSSGGRILACRLDASWLKPGGEGLQTLAWTIRPWPAPFDARKLGLPLARLWIYPNPEPA